MSNITLGPLSTSTRPLVITDWTRQQTETTTESIAWNRTTSPDLAMSFGSPSRRKSLSLLERNLNANADIHGDGVIMTTSSTETVKVLHTLTKSVSTGNIGTMRPPPTDGVGDRAVPLSPRRQARRSLVSGATVALHEAEYRSIRAILPAGGSKALPEISSCSDDAETERHFAETVFRFRNHASRF